MGSPARQADDQLPTLGLTHGHCQRKRAFCNQAEDILVSTTLFYVAKRKKIEYKDMQYLRYIELQMDLKTNVDSLMLLHFLKIQFIFAIQIIRHVLNFHPWVKVKISNASHLRSLFTENLIF